MHRKKGRNFWKVLVLPRNNCMFPTKVRQDLKFAKSWNFEILLSQNICLWALDSSLNNMCIASWCLTELHHRFLRGVLQKPALPPRRQIICTPPVVGIYNWTFFTLPYQIKGRGYLPELFRQIRTYLLEQVRQITYVFTLLNPPTIRLKNNKIFGEKSMKIHFINGEPPKGIWN